MQSADRSTTIDPLKWQEKKFIHETKVGYDTRAQWDFKID